MEEAKKLPPYSNTLVGPDKGERKRICPTAPVRKLAILSNSVILARFEEFFTAAKRKTLVDDVARFGSASTAQTG